jgi:prepilin-type N-terminal cleavage/methylation domain-containing protein
MNLCAKKSFTLMEIIIVVIILGVIASFAIPSYFKSMECSYRDDAINQLKAIYGAEQIYYARTGTYWPAAALDSECTSGDSYPCNTVSINQRLNLHIIENSGLTYQCQFINGPPNPAAFCEASYQGGKWEVPLEIAVGLPLSDENPHCQGSCP